MPREGYEDAMMNFIDEMKRDAEKAEESPAEHVEESAEAVPEQAPASPAGDTDIPEGMEELADLRGKRPERKNAKPVVTHVVSRTRTIRPGPFRDDDDEEEREDGGSGLSYNRQGPGAAERKAEAREKREQTREESREWKSARDALREAGTPHAISRTVYVDGESKTKHLQLLLQPTLFEALREAADEDGVSVNEYVNQAIREKILK